MTTTRWQKLKCLLGFHNYYLDTHLYCCQYCPHTRELTDKERELDNRANIARAYIDNVNDKINDEAIQFHEECGDR